MDSGWAAVIGSAVGGLGTFSATWLSAYLSRKKPEPSEETKAKAEGALSLYGAGPAAPCEAAVAAFNAKYPGIKVSLTGGFSNVMDAQIDQQLKTGKVMVDVAALQTVQDFVRWAKAGALLPFKPKGFDQIDGHWKDKNGAYVALSVNAHTYAYNPRLVKPEDVPKSALDFLSPRFRGKTVAAYPQDDDATLYDFDSIVRKYDWGWMQKYMANKPNFIQGHLGVARSISAGENLVTLDNITDISRSEKAAGKPQEIAISTIDPLPIWPLTAAVFRRAPHPNAAKLFLDFYLSKEWQSRLNTWSSRADVPPPAGLKPVLSYKVVNTYRDFLTDEKKLIALRKHYAAIVGPIKNAGGVK